MRKLKIGNRLILGYILILLFSISTIFVAIIELNKIWGDTKNLYEKPFMVSNLLRDVKINALNIRRYLLDMTYLKNLEEIKEVEAEIDSEESLALKNYAQIEKLYEGDKKILEESVKMFEKWRTLREDVIELIKNGQKAESSNLLINRNREFVTSLFSNIQYLIDETSARAESLYKSAETTNKEIVKRLFGLLIISLILSIILAYIITRSITRPLDDIVKNIREIAKGNLNNNRLKEERDEIGQLAQSFNLMQENLAEKGIIAERIAQGDFSAQVKPGGENDIVAKSINMIANNFDLVVKQAQKVAAGDFETGINGIAESNPLSVVISQMLDSLKEVVSKARQVAQGDYSGQIVPKSKSDELAISLNKMTESLRTAINQNLRQNRLKTAQNELNENMRGDLSLEVMAKNIITYVAKYTNAQIGALYLHSKEENGYILKGSYAFHYRKGINTFFKDGDGLIGQAALEKEMITFSELPDDYVRITSGIGETVPRNIVVAPFVYEGSTVGVIELGAVSEFSDEAYEFLKMVLENIAISVTSANNRTQMAHLLNITSRQAEELQVQQEELKQSNEELEAQTQALKRSEEYLQTQQEELRVTNEELQEKTRHLEKQQEQMKIQNQELEQARLNVEKKANELEVTNKYKSEFLANMSHELRTPLNSLLILSQTLMENKDNNLNENQLKSAEIIYNSGNDLLKLINDILDLSKIESGKMSISLGNINLANITTSIHNYFEQILKEKGLELKIEVEKDLPEQIVTDEQRLNQILLNLLSNAAKFTEKGGVHFRIFKPHVNEDLTRSGLKTSNTIAFSIKDTGIGIPQNKQLEIFEAFQQVDGSISRKYGGTGLGLSITRELVKMLGGEIKLQSEPGKGSEFTVFLPIDATGKVVKPENRATPLKATDDSKKEAVKTRQADIQKTARAIADERANIGPTDPSILIIEDDVNFAETLAKICKEKGFFYLSVATGEEGIELARQYLPKGILLDINLPGMNGWDVLDALKNSAETRHIPVHFISGYEETIEAYNKGAIGFLSKPVTKEKLESAIDQIQHLITRRIKDLLLIEDDENLQKSIKSLLEAKDILITESTTARNAIELITTRQFDCIVLDLGLPDMNGFEMLKYLKENKIKIPPIVVYTGKEISPEENDELQYYTQNIIIKGVKSEERLLDETSLFLHRVVDDMPDRQKKMLTNLYDKDQMFRNKKILIVDDDMRNVFAITRLLEESHMQVVMAPNGVKALDILGNSNDIDLILMDIMMPVMDGYETMKQIRKNKIWDKVPIIALTAKAMKEDRDKSIAAGANDYLSKPVDIQKLFNLMRIWLYQ